MQLQTLFINALVCNFRDGFFFSEMYTISEMKK